MHEIAVKLIGNHANGVPHAVEKFLRNACSLGFATHFLAGVRNRPPSMNNFNKFIENYATDVPHAAPDTKFLPNRVDA